MIKIYEKTYEVEKIKKIAYVREPKRGNGYV